MIISSARNIFRTIVLTRRWNALHGGVYAPVDKTTPPNPYLKDPMRDIVVNKHLTLTKINPAYMTRQISELSQRETGVYFRIVGLNPQNPLNSPNRIEKLALMSFREGKREYVQFFKDHTFYMAPLKAEKPCLKCHAFQGYKVGDVMGGISVYLPQTVKIPYAKAGAFLILELIIIPIIFIGLRYSKLYEQFKFLSFYDPLTQILNRRALEERIWEEFNRAIRYKYPFSLIMCDVDWFKKYNDTYGHKEGDKVLHNIAQEMRASTRKSGDFVGRYGREEFIIALLHTDINGALSVAKRIKSRIEGLNIKHEKSPFGKVTISCGVFVMNPDDELESWEELIKKADALLYKAKETGKNSVVGGTNSKIYNLVDEDFEKVEIESLNFFSV